MATRAAFEFFTTHWHAGSVNAGIKNGDRFLIFGRQYQRLERFVQAGRNRFDQTFEGTTLDRDTGVKLQIAGRFAIGSALCGGMTHESGQCGTVAFHQAEALVEGAASGVARRVIVVVACDFNRSEKGLHLQRARFVALFQRARGVAFHL